MQNALQEMKNQKTATRNLIIGGHATEESLEELLNALTTLGDAVREEAEAQNTSYPEISLDEISEGGAIFKQLHQDTFTNIYQKIAVELKEADIEMEALLSFDIILS